MGRMDDLGPELISRVLSKSRLSPVELCRLSILGRDWKEAVASHELWKSIELKVPEYSRLLLISISKHCGRLSELHVSRDPIHPRALSLPYCSAWIDGVEEVLVSASSSLKKLVISTGCNIYKKDYRSALFYAELMIRVTNHCRCLEVCEIYYNAGRSGMKSDIPQWIFRFIQKCPQIEVFRLWSPSGDCGGLENKCIAAMVTGWACLQHLELTGEAVTLDGVILLKACSVLRTARLSHISLGAGKRPGSLRVPDDYRDSRPCKATDFRELELAHTNCDLLDVQIIHREFPGLYSIRIIEYPEVSHLDDSGDEAETTEPAVLSEHLQRLADLRSSCAEDDTLSSIVTFVDL